jgi:hypothetical protein
MASTFTDTTTPTTASVAVADTSTTPTTTPTTITGHSSIYLNALCHRDLAPELLSWKRFQGELDDATLDACSTFQAIQTQSIGDGVFLGSMTPLERLVFAEAMDEASERIAMVLDILPKVDCRRYAIDDYGANGVQWEDIEEWIEEQVEHGEEPSANMDDPAGYLEDVVALGWFD